MKVRLETYIDDSTKKESESNIEIIKEVKQPIPSDTFLINVLYLLSVKFSLEITGINSPTL